ncbi:putative lipoprotein, partial [Vibrio harveyi]
GVRFT